MVKIVVCGALGRMGRSILKLAHDSGEFEIVGATERKGHESIGKELRELNVCGSRVTLSSELREVIGLCDVVIDFTEPRASLEHFQIARDYGKPIVIGTTGFSDEELSFIRAQKNVKVLISPNMSFGMNLMYILVKVASILIEEGFDVEIVEVHHRMKKDSPSGTARRLKEVILESYPSYAWEPKYGRFGIHGERKKEEIGIMSLRGGDVVGEHTVSFFGIGERIEITHRATSRENFAKGALLAAKWIVGKEPGIYSMEDVLSESLRKISLDFTRMSC